MQQRLLDYLSPTKAVRRLTRKEIVGRSIAITSLVLPFFAFAVLLSITAATGADPSKFLRLFCVSSLAVSCTLGVIGLCGIFWWGEKGVWAPAVLGIAFSVSWYVLAKYGGG